MKQVAVVENVLKLNDQVAAMNRRQFVKAGVLVIDLMGAPGAGKTALLQKTLAALWGKRRCGVIVGDPATQRDADRMAAVAEQIVQVNTGKGCHLEAHHVRQALGNLDLGQLDVLFIENVGNLICPVGFDLGQHVKVGLFCIPDGDDKAAKHPYIVTESNLLLLGKIDLLPYVPFDLELFRADIQRLKPGQTLMELSIVSGVGFQGWVDWVLQQDGSKKS